MKRLITFFALVFCVSVQIFGQDVKQKEAKILLDEVSTKFKALNSFHANFTMLMESPATDMKEEYSGEITAQGDKFKLLIKGNDPKEIYNNGTTIWTYFPEEEVTISDVEEGENGLLSISKLINMYKTGYKYLIEGKAVVNGKNCQIVVLNPEIINGQSSNPDIFKIRLWIDSKTKEMVSWKIFEKNGNRYTTTITKFIPNHSVTPTMFTFDTKAHKGIEINDMRE